MKVLFLDVDGVLCLGNPWRYLEESCVLALRHIMEQVPDLALVLSSDWRKEELLEDQLGHALEQYGIPRPEFATPIFRQSKIDWSRYQGMKPSTRGALRTEEIIHWLQENPVENFVAVDDTPLYVPGFFQTHPHQGLTLELANEIIGYLTEETT